MGVGERGPRDRLSLSSLDCGSELANSRIVGGHESPIEISPGKPQEFHPRLGNTGVAPHRNGGGADLAQFGHLNGASQAIDDQFGDRVRCLVHERDLSALKEQSQGTLKPATFKLALMNTMISRLMAARAWREDKLGRPFTNAEFARGLHVKQAAVNYWQEKQEGDLKTETVFQAADFLGVDARWLATGAGRMADDSGVADLQADVIARLEDGSTIIAEFKTPKSALSPWVRNAMRTMLEASAANAPRELFDAVSTIFTLLPHHAGASIQAPLTQGMEAHPPLQTASQSIRERAAWEEREAESHLQSRAGGARDDKESRPRKGKGVRH
jgi:hypothetical protein